MSKNPADVLLKKIRRAEGNMICPNCGTAAQRGIGFGNVCVKFRTFVCDMCKTSHQAISHRVKSITMSNWTMDEVIELLDTNCGGNDACRHIWLENAPECGGRYPGGVRPKQGAKIENFKQFVTDCYEYGKFKAELPYEPHGNDVNSSSTTPRTPSSPSTPATPQSPVNPMSRSYVSDQLSHQNSSTAPAVVATSAAPRLLDWDDEPSASGIATGGSGGGRRGGVEAFSAFGDDNVDDFGSFDAFGGDNSPTRPANHGGDGTNNSISFDPFDNTNNGNSNHDNFGTSNSSNGDFDPFGSNNNLVPVSGPNLSPSNSGSGGGGVDTAAFDPFGDFVGDSFGGSSVSVAPSTANYSPPPLVPSPPATNPAAAVPDPFGFGSLLMPTPPASNTGMNNNNNSSSAATQNGQSRALGGTGTGFNGGGVPMMRGMANNSISSSSNNNLGMGMGMGINTGMNSGMMMMMPQPQHPQYRGGNMGMGMGMGMGMKNGGSSAGMSGGTATAGGIQQSRGVGGMYAMNNNNNNNATAYANRCSPSMSSNNTMPMSSGNVNISMMNASNFSLGISNIPSSSSTSSSLSSMPNGGRQQQLHQPKQSVNSFDFLQNTMQSAVNQAGGRR